MAGYRHWFSIHPIRNPAYGECSVVFDPTGPVSKEVEVYRQRLSAASGQKEPLYNGYDWAMMFMNHLSAHHPEFRARTAENKVEIFGSTEGITAPCDSEATSQDLIRHCIALLENEALAAQMIRDGLTVD